VIPLGATLAARRASGRRLLVAYLMAGSTPDWLDVAEGLVAAGVDALEVGLAFSDPMIDGPVIQTAAARALAAHATLPAVVADLSRRSLGVPLVAMTYVNVVAAPGYSRAAGELAAAGVSGVILPDLPLEAVDPWHAAAHPQGLETVLLAAPSTPPDRLARLCARTEGFLYAVGRMATTGEAHQLDPGGLALVDAAKARTDLPVLLGIGISTPAHAAAACAVADGVIVGSAVVRRMLDGEGAERVADFARSLREAIDEAG
jgi:tryptophan synthase alpha chain